jgi:hypothetical protein
LNDLRHSISWWSGPNLTLIRDQLYIKIKAVHVSLPRIGIIERALKKISKLSLIIRIVGLLITWMRKNLKSYLAG